MPNLRWTDIVEILNCGISVPEIEPRSFSFNNPFGACPNCAGLGYSMEFAPELIIPDDTRSINEGAIAVLGWQSCMNKGSFANAILVAMSQKFGFSLDTPYKDLPEDIRNMLMYGTDKSVDVYYEGQRGKGVYPITFEGIIRNTERRYRETGSESSKAEYESFMRIEPCKVCKGKRLRKESLAVNKLKLLEQYIDYYYYKSDEVSKEDMQNGMFKGLVDSLGDAL